MTTFQMALKVLLDGSKGKNEVRLFKNSAHEVLIQLVTVNFIQLGWKKKFAFPCQANKNLQVKLLLNRHQKKK